MTQWKLRPPTFFDRLNRFFRSLRIGVELAWRDSFKTSDDDFYPARFWREKPNIELSTDGLYRVRQRFTIDNDAWRCDDGLDEPDPDAEYRKKINSIMPPDPDWEK